MSEYCALIDTETNWYDEVMSIGLIIFKFDNYKIIKKLYFVIYPEYKCNGMFSLQLFNTRKNKTKIEVRERAILDINDMLRKYNVNKIFAYNAKFDFNHLPELSPYLWIDIMRIAAYRQYNEKLPKNAEYCTTGKLVRNYGVEVMYSLLSGKEYHEVHNAICDAEDELEIMKMLNKDIDLYYLASINYNKIIEDYEDYDDSIYQDVIPNLKDIENKKTEIASKIDFEEEKRIVDETLLNHQFENGEVIYHINY